ncbi:MAG: N-formylglutamate amidohydrolase [Nanoarchaeota archaeon]|nr:N-formylglutamate amidohydrolase [Nanoarchaeota archaeon]
MKGTVNPVKTENPNGDYIVAIPHAGQHIPSNLDNVLMKDRVTSRGTDEFSGELYSPLTKAGGTVISSDYHRYVCDLNRHRNDTSDQGAIRKVGMQGRQVLKRDYTPDEREGIFKECYDTFHKELESIVESYHSKQGHVFLLAAHTMSDVGAQTAHDKGKERPDICYSTNNDMIADHEVIKAFEEVMKEAEKKGYKVSKNKPFTGKGPISKKYGRPKEGYNVIQLEVKESLAEDEATREELIGIIQDACERAVAKMKEIYGKEEAGQPKKTGEGRGERAQKGRGGHEEEEQEAKGKGSDTYLGPKAEAEHEEELEGEDAPEEGSEEALDEAA